MINNEEQLYKERTSKLAMIMVRMLTKLRTLNLGSLSYNSCYIKKIKILREEATSVLTGFHKSLLSWSNWNLEVGFWGGREKNLGVRRNEQQTQRTSGAGQESSKARALTTPPILLSKGLECMFRTFAANFPNTPRPVDHAAVNRRRKHCPVIVGIRCKKEIKFFDVFYSMQ